MFKNSPSKCAAALPYELIHRKPNSCCTASFHSIAARAGREGLVAAFLDDLQISHGDPRYREIRDLEVYLKDEEECLEHSHESVELFFRTIWVER